MKTIETWINCDFCGDDIYVYTDGSSDIYGDEFDNTVCKKCHDNHAFANAAAEEEAVMITRQCEGCKASFEPDYKDQFFCQVCLENTPDTCQFIPMRTEEDRCRTCGELRHCHVEKPS